jgi:ankyrin repeat protein
MPPAVSGEQILFPESDEEESDWIVSDFDDSSFGGCGDSAVENAPGGTKNYQPMGDEPLVEVKFHISVAHMFSDDVKSSVFQDFSKFADTYLNSANPNTLDGYGLYPLIYAAALADEGAMQQLLSVTSMELVEEVFTNQQISLLTVIIEAPLRKARRGAGAMTGVEDDVSSLKCLQVYQSYSRRGFLNAMVKSREQCRTALSVAVWNRKPQCATYLIKNGAETNTFSTTIPTLLHLAVMANENDQQFSKDKSARRRDICVAILLCLLPLLIEEINIRDQSGFTPLMISCEVGDVGCLQVLLDCGASISCWDAQRTSPLHLAAVSGWTDCINELLTYNHPVDCVDEKGWPPLLYAHFQNHQDCVLALMKAKPEQLSILSNLIQVNRDAEGWVLTAKVVRSLLVSLAHHEAYHALFNKFIQENPLILEEKEYGFLKHCMGLLDYRNKLTWIQRKFATLIENARIAAVPLLSLVSLPRSSPEGILAFVHKTFCNTSPLSYWKSSLTVTFENEAGKTHHSTLFWYLT